MSAVLCVTRNLERTSEFRKLCEVLRYHLTGIKRAHQPDQQLKMGSVNLYDQPTLSKFLGVRFRLLDAATKLDMWSEVLYCLSSHVDLMFFGVTVAACEYLAPSLGVPLWFSLSLPLPSSSSSGL